MKEAAGTSRAVAPCRIRPANRRDLPDLVKLLCELFAIETDFAVRPERHLRGLRLLLRQARRGLGAVRVAVVDAKVVGMATVQVVVSTAAGARSGWIEDVIVAPELRGRGIGAQLMAAVAGWAGRRGVRRLQLLADERNRPALAFYDRLGYTRAHMVALRGPTAIPGETHRASPK